MNKREILDEAFRSERFNQVIKNICKSKPQYIDDIKQEVFIMLLEKKDELIEDLHAADKLIAYFTRIVHTQVTSSTSRFHYIYRKHNENLTDQTAHFASIQDDARSHSDFDILEYLAKNRILTWYETEIFNLYYRMNPSAMSDDISEKMSYEKMAGLIGIRKRRVYDQMTKIKAKIFKHISEDEELSNDIPFENLLFMQEFLDKNEKVKNIY